jgi:hypothetical protein
MDMETTSDFWDSGKRYRTGPPLTDGMVREAERLLGYRLPESYLRLLRQRNGGEPRRCCFPTTVRTYWAEDHICIRSLLGVGFEQGIDGEMESRYLIPEWGYPDVGIVIADTPSAGHDVVMLDYSLCGPQGEPRVIHVETESEEPIVIVLAPDVEAFAKGLVDCSRYDEEDG